MSLIYERQRYIESTKKPELELDQDSFFIEGAICRQRSERWKQAKLGILTGIALSLLISTGVIAHKRIDSQPVEHRRISHLKQNPANFSPQIESAKQQLPAGEKTSQGVMLASLLPGEKPLVIPSAQQWVGRRAFSRLRGIASLTYLTDRPDITEFDITEGAAPQPQPGRSPLDNADKLFPDTESMNPAPFRSTGEYLRSSLLKLNPQQVLRYQFETNQSLASAPYKSSLLASSTDVRLKGNPLALDMSFNSFLAEGEGVVQMPAEDALLDAELKAISPSGSADRQAIKINDYSSTPIPFIERDLPSIEKPLFPVINTGQGNAIVEQMF